jgi:phosphoribosylanthranilate isomerase
VFRNATPDEVRRTVEVAKLDLVQLHGDETYRLELPTIKAVHVQDSLPSTETHADYLLFDTGGGTGRVFDWELLAGYGRAKPFFLAGGITPDNVAEAIEKTKPYAVDVASGVEDRPGVKDHRKLKAFFEAIKR